MSSQTSKGPVESGWGIISRVSSGDSVAFWKCAPVGGRMTMIFPPVEREVTLANCSAPRLNPPKRSTATSGPSTSSSATTTDEEAFAWQSRENLRNLCIGKLVKFEVEHKHPTSGRCYGNVYLNDSPSSPTHLGIAQALAGWIRVRRPANAKSLPPADSIQGQLFAAGNEAEASKRGLFQDPVPSDAIRKFPARFDSYQLFSRIRKAPQQFIVEQVKDGTCVRGYLLPSFHYLTLRLAGAQAPIVPYDPKEKKELAPEPHYPESKHFTDSHVLARVSSVTFHSVDKQDATFFASINLNGHDLSLELLKLGFARYVEWSTPRPLQDAYLAAEAEAKARRLVIWRNFAAPVISSSPVASSSTQTTTSSSPQDFQGVVREIRGNGDVVIRDAATSVLQTVSLSSLVIPRYGRTRDLDEPYGFEAHEFLRSQLRGKVVRARFDYVRPANPERSLTEKVFYSVSIGDKDIGAQLLAKGWAKLIVHREGAQRSPAYSEYLVAEGDAKLRKLGVHGNVAKAPKHRVNDITQKSSSAADSSKPTKGKKSKDSNLTGARRHLPFLLRAGRQPAVVEYVYSADRFKIFIPSESVIINFTLASVRAPKDGADPLTASINDFAREELTQMDVEIEVEKLDTIGTFVGTLWLRKRNFAASLVETGRARVVGHSGNFLRDLQQLETQAKIGRLGVWHDWDPEEERLKNEKAAVASGENTLAVTQEWMRVQVTDIIDAGWFFVQILGDELDSFRAVMSQVNSSLPVDSPAFNPRVGDLCLARFPADNQWYRSKILSVQDNAYSVFLIDLGPEEVLSRSELRPLDAQLASIPPQARECVLAFITPPRLREDYGEEAASFFRDLVWNKPLVANIEYRDGSVLYVSLGDPTTQVLINISMIGMGYALVQQRKEPHLRPVIQNFLTFQEEALRSHRGMWEYGDFRDEE